MMRPWPTGGCRAVNKQTVSRSNGCIRVVPTFVVFLLSLFMYRAGSQCCIRYGPDEERILDVVPREDGARNSG